LPTGVLTAAHLGSPGPVKLNGITYQPVPGSGVDFSLAPYEAPPSSHGIDVLLFRVHPPPPIAPIGLATVSPPVGTPVTMIGRGHDRGQAITVDGFDGFLWADTFGTKRWGTNTVSPYLDGANQAFWTTFDRPGEGTSDECQAAVHDSGGGVFQLDASGIWMLSGIMSSIFSPSGVHICPGPNPLNCSFYTDVTGSANISLYAANIQQKLALSECADGLDDDGDAHTDGSDPGCRDSTSAIEDPACDDHIDNDGDGLVDTQDPGCNGHGYGLSETGDSDSDGVLDATDNCVLRSNVLQTDTDHDGFGNACDPDFDQNSVVNFADLAYMKSKFFSTDALADLNADGYVNFADLAILKSYFFKPPGPHGP